ncbi:MAG: hypothetical protein GY847_15170 [Proteobacteria bacterium]|nr:hypothetical protein [Pseudomonadota bacterium]
MFHSEPMAVALKALQEVSETMFEVSLQTKEDVFSFDPSFMWSERNLKSFIHEIVAMHREIDPNDSWYLGQSLSLFQEFGEFLPETADDWIHSAIDENRSILKRRYKQCQDC